MRPEKLIKAAQKAILKSGGPDGWTAPQLLRLPVDFWEMLAELWQTILDGAPVPKVWKTARVVLIPKPEGGDRPLTIASTLWRLGMSTMI